jgi:hypothetical protein
MDRWPEYLFEAHSEETLRGWAKLLALFRFCRAYGGHANDADTLEVAYRYGNLTDLRAFLATLGVELVVYSERPPQPQAGVSYAWDEYARFPSLIAGTEWAKQPGHCRIAEQRVFVWCQDGVVKLSLGSQYEVSEADVLAAAQVERALAQVRLARVDPPRDSQHCICPKYYPDFFA